MIETQRLLLIPLTYDQLLKYRKNDQSLEAELGLIPSSRIISAELREALEQTIIPNLRDAGGAADKNYLFSTIWTIIIKSEYKMAADLCFLGDPNQEGVIEIGYGTYAQNRSKGFMTEAVEAMIHWAESQPQVRAIVASTDKTNLASSKVLEKNNFIKIGETADQFQWRINLYTINLY